MRFPGFIGPTYSVQSLNVDCQRCINLFPQLNETGHGKAQEVGSLMPTPGLALLLTLAGGAVRGTFTASNGQMFAVGGNKFYSISSGFVATERGTLVSTTGPVSMSDNGQQLIIVDGTSAGYYWTFTNTNIAQVDTFAVNSLSGVPGYTYQFRVNNTLISYATLAGDAYFSILQGLANSMLANGMDSTCVISGSGSSALLTITANTPGTPNLYAAQVDTISVNSLTGVPGHVYSFKIGSTTVSYTSLAGDSYPAILNGLNAALVASGLPSSGVVSGAGSGSVLTITANVAVTPNVYSSVDSELTLANVIPVDGQLTLTNVIANTSTGPSFQTITDGGFYGADTVDFIDGYFTLNKPGTGIYYISGLDDISFNALDFSSSEGAPDNVVGLLAIHRELWVFNSQSTEVFFNSGAAAFPFERIQGAFIEIGCAAPHSIAKLQNSAFWIGTDRDGTGIVYMANSYTPQRISTHAIEQAIQGYSTIADAVGYTYQDAGHSFYVLNFPSGGATWVYDLTTGLWHERSYTNQGQFERHRAVCHSLFNGVHVVGDYANGNLYKMSTAAQDDNGTAIRRRRTAPHITDDLNRVFYNRFQLDIETGVGVDGLGQGVDPQVMLRFSDDGGHSWSNEKWVSFGKIGARRNRAIWRRLGRSRDRVFEITITDPVKVVLIGAELDTQGGTS